MENGVRDYFDRLRNASRPLNAPIEQKAEGRQDPDEFLDGLVISYGSMQKSFIHERREVLR